MTRPAPPQRWALAAAPVAVVAGIVAALQPWEQRVHTAYWDHLGSVWTICAGVTGPDVVQGLTLTDAECEAKETAYVERMLGHMGGCVKEPLAFHEIKAWGHFSYNIGTRAFCESTAAKWLNKGEHSMACGEIPKWTFTGGKNCRLNASKCAGLPKRRAWEYATCEGIL